MSFRPAILALMSAFVLAACSDTVTPTAPARLPTAASLVMDPAVCNGATMPVAECQALVSLYNSTNGPGWIDNTGWGTANPCTWLGIVCTNGDQGSVRLIVLTSNELTGQLPDALGALTGLERLALNWNNLSGSIPAVLGSLPNIEDIQMWENEFSGSIPAALGNAPNLRFLSLHSNNLSGAIPQALFDAPKLERVSLSQNALTGSIPAAVGTAPNLEYFDVGENAITGTIPPQLGNLSKLDVLALDHNQMTGPIPAALGGLVNLRVLVIENNAFTGPLPDLTQWPKLDRTRIQENQFTGQVPLAIAAFAENIEFECIFAPGNAGLFVPDLPAYRAVDLDGDGTICGLAFASAADIGEDAIEDIEDLVPTTLNSGQATALQTKIDNAVDKADKGQYSAAINQIQAFLTQLADMVSAGTLTPAQAAPFVTQAQALIAIWTDLL
jgi:hypothetical protein